jgi:ABC-2 type transport system ATP-binding protein
MIIAENLRKHYGNQTALDGISFSIREGEFYGLLGPNGAGKTTTISIISSILEPDSGKVTINGMDLSQHRIACKRLIGVVPQEIALYDRLSAEENLMFWGSLYGVDKQTLRKRSEETLRLLGLYDRRADKVKTYSGGMKRRINIASALLHQPKILFMDEPTVGIDPQSRNLIFDVVEQLHREGITIVYTTHYMEEAERFCDRIGIIDKGKIIAEGTVQELRGFSQMKESVMIRFSSLSEEKEKQIREKLSGDFSLNDSTLTYFSANVQSDMPKLIQQCSELSLEFSHIDISKVTLETIFLHLTGKQLRD